MVDIVVRTIVVFDMGSQYQLISEIDGLKFKGSVVGFWKKHVYLKPYELNNIDMV